VPLLQLNVPAPLRAQNLARPDGHEETQRADGYGDRIRHGCTPYHDRAERVRPGSNEQGEAQPYRHPGQPGRETLLFRRGLDGAGADVPVQPERNPAAKNEDSGQHGANGIAGATRTATPGKGARSGIADDPRCFFCSLIGRLEIYQKVAFRVSLDWIVDE
jgi:hypothetical protein